MFRNKPISSSSSFVLRYKFLGYSCESDIRLFLYFYRAPLKCFTCLGLHNVYDSLRENGFSNLQGVRVPVVEERAPDEKCFDILIDSLKQVG